MSIHGEKIFFIISDRERVLARRRKFESSQAVKAENKVISLKCVKPSSDEPSVEEAKVSKIGAKKTNRQVSDEFGDAISLSVDDTLVRLVNSTRTQNNVCHPLNL